MKTIWADEEETMTACPPCAGKGSMSLPPEQEGFYRFEICTWCRGRGQVTASRAAEWKLLQLHVED
jgi:DnaJ-class molecular chaperone